MTRNTIAYDSIQELKEGIDYSNFEYAYITGYYTSNDGGNCIFIWDVNNSNLDDGFLYIKPNYILAQGRWVRLFETNIINVLTAGVKRNNFETDALYNSANIDKILSYAKANKNVIIYFPTGNYHLADSIRMPSYTTLAGDGTGTCLIPATGIYEKNSYKLGVIQNEFFDAEDEVNHNSNIMVKSLCINAKNKVWVKPDASNTRTRGIYFNKVECATIFEVTILDTPFNASGIQIRNYVPNQYSSPNPTYSFIVRDCFIRNCHIQREILTSISNLNYEANIYIDSTMTGSTTNSDNRPATTINVNVSHCILIGGIHGIVYANIKDSSIENCYIKQGVRGIVLGPTSENIVVSENTILESLGTGIHIVYRTNSVLIRSNLVKIVFINTGIYEGNGIKSYMGCSNISVINNEVSGCATEGIAFFSGGLVYNINISGNLVNDNRGAGILLSPGKIDGKGEGDINIYSSVISNNISRGNTTGIKLIKNLEIPLDNSYANQKITISGNLVTNNITNGIVIDNSYTVLLESNNVLYNNTEYLIGNDVTLTSNSGNFEIIADGITKIFSFPHKIYNTPSTVTVTPFCEEATAPHFISIDSYYIIVNFLNPPNNGKMLTWNWFAEKK